MESIKNKLVNALGSRDVAASFYLGISELFFELEIDGQNFVDDFILNYLNHAANKVENKGEVQLKTGFTKYQITQYFKGELKRSSNSEKNLYNRILERIKFVTKNNPEKIIPIKRHKHSFTTIFNNLDASTMLTSKMMLDSLINRGFVEYVDENHIRYISPNPQTFVNTPEKIIQLFCDLTYRASKTLIHNLNAEAGKEKYQRSLMSDRVPPEKYDVVEKGVKSILEKAYKECQELIDANEVTDEFAIKQVEKLGQELGFSAFYFNNKI